MRFSKAPTKRIDDQYPELLINNSFSQSSQCIQTNKENQDFSQTRQSQVRGLFKKNQFCYRKNTASSTATQSQITSLLYQQKGNYQQRRDPPKPQEYPLRSLQLESLSEFNLQTRDQSFSIDSDKKNNPYDQHFRDTAGRQIELTGLSSDKGGDVNSIQFEEYQNNNQELDVNQKLPISFFQNKILSPQSAFNQVTTSPLLKHTKSQIKKKIELNQHLVAPVLKQTRNGRFSSITAAKKPVQYSSSRMSFQFENQIKTKYQINKMRKPLASFDVQSLQTQSQERSNRVCPKISLSIKEPTLNSMIFSPKANSEIVQRSKSQAKPAKVASPFTTDTESHKKLRMYSPPQAQFKYIDETLRSPSNTIFQSQTLNQLKDQLSYVKQRMQSYAQFINRDRILQICSLTEPPSSGYLKAFRSLCLLLKATTRVTPSYTNFKQIKDTEVFQSWDRIKSYLNSAQGSVQINELNQMIDSSNLTENLSRLAMSQLEQKIFSQMESQELDLQSPRVKNQALKAYFCLPYFYLVYIKITDKIKKEETRIEQELFTGDKQLLQILQISSSNLSNKDFKFDDVAIQTVDPPKNMRLNKRAVATQEKQKFVQKSVTPTRPVSANYQRETISTTIKKLQGQIFRAKRSVSRGSTVPSRTSQQQNTTKKNNQSTIKKLSYFSKSKSRSPQRHEQLNLSHYQYKGNNQLKTNLQIAYQDALSPKEQEKVVDMFSSQVKMGIISTDKLTDSAAISPKFRKLPQADPQPEFTFKSNHKDPSLKWLSFIKNVEIDEFINNGQVRIENLIKHAAQTNKKQSLTLQTEKLKSIFVSQDYKHPKESTQHTAIGDGLRYMESYPTLMQSTTNISQPQSC